MAEPSYVNLESLGQPIPEHIAFDDVPNNVRENTMHWEGPVSQIVAEIGAAPEPLPGELSWHPTRLVRAVLDNPKLIPEQERVRLVSDTTLFALGACAGIVDRPLLTKLTEQFDRYGLMRRMVRHSYDPWSFTGTDPERSEASAAWIREHIGEPVLLVAVCHGGLPAATRAMLELPGAVMYPIKLSRAKRFQRNPQTSPSEIEHLKTLAADRHVVVFDEDAKTGKTVQRVMEHLQRHGIPARGITGLVNHDQRSRRHRSGQGEHWEVTVPADRQASYSDLPKVVPHAAEFLPSGPGDATIGHVMQEVYGVTSDLPFDEVAVAGEQIGGAIAAIADVSEGSPGLTAVHEHLGIAHDQLTTVNSHLTTAREKLTAYLLAIGFGTDRAA